MLKYFPLSQQWFLQQWLMHFFFWGEGGIKHRSLNQSPLSVVTLMKMNGPFPLHTEGQGLQAFFPWLCYRLYKLTQQASLILLEVQEGRNGEVEKYSSFGWTVSKSHLARHSRLVKGRLALRPQTQLAVGHHVVQSFAYLITFVFLPNAH